MIFKDLIAQLKKVKTEKDITEDLALELIDAGIFSNMNSLNKEYGDMDPQEAFEMTRSAVLRQLDAVLISMITGDDFEGPNDMPSPMDDPKLNKAIQKAMDEYNDRIDNNPPPPPNLRKV